MLVRRLRQTGDGRASVRARARAALRARPLAAGGDRRAVGAAVLVAVLTGLVGRSRQAPVANPPPVLVAAATPVAGQGSAGASATSTGAGARGTIVAQPSSAQQSQVAGAPGKPVADPRLDGLDGRLLPDLLRRPEHVRRQLAADRLDPRAGVGVLDGSQHLPRPELRRLLRGADAVQRHATGAGGHRIHVGSRQRLLPSTGRRPAAYDHTTTSHPSIYDDFDAIMAAAHLLSADGATLRSNRAPGTRRMTTTATTPPASPTPIRCWRGRSAGHSTGSASTAGSNRRWSKPCTPPMARPCWRRSPRPKPRAEPRRRGSGRVGLRDQLARDAVGSPAGAAEQAPGQLGAPEVQRRVVLPGRADAAVHRDHRARGVVERAPGHRARGPGRERELLRRPRGPSRRSTAASARSPAGAAPPSASA